MMLLGCGTGLDPSMSTHDVENPAEQDSDATFCVGAFPPVASEYFGDGCDGDFTVPLGSTLVLTRDMFWHNLTFLPGATTRIDPNGFAIRVSGTLRGPGLTSLGQPQAFISRDGNPAQAPEDGGDPGAGYAPSGTIGQGGSGTGGVAGGAPADAGGFPTNGGLGVWFSDFHPSDGGSSGSAELTAGATGIGAQLASPTAGSTDLFNAIRMRLIDGTPVSGGAPGGGGAGGGGGGGAGGGNIVLLANFVELETSIVVSSRGGDGGNAVVANGGGGGGGGGGYITLVVYRLPYPVTAITGGAAGTGLGDANDGQPGGSGIVLPFRFVL
jgi:hypothetical protein